MKQKPISYAEYDLKLWLGLELFKKGMDICRKGSVEELVMVDDDIKVIKVTDLLGSSHKVIRRTKSGDVLCYDCDCGSSTCEHIAAAAIKPELPFEEDYEFDEEDEETIREIEEMIREMDSLVEEDSDFDHEAWAYQGEYWYEKRYGTEGTERNYEIAYDVALDVFEEIMGRLQSPHSIESMLREFCKYNGDYIGDAPCDVVRDHRKDVDAILSYTGCDISDLGC